MKHNKLIIVHVFILLVLILVPFVAQALDVTVINTNNSGAGSLRQAIMDINASIDPSNTIDFNIGGSTPHVISPGSSLPVINKQVLIDGFTQSGYATGVPAVVIDGSSAGSYTIGLNFNTAGCTVRGLRIQNFYYDGIRITGSDCTVSGCHLLDNGDTGVYLYNATGCIIGGTDEADRNIISTNGYTGIYLSGASCSNNTVLGNFIGVDSTGLTALGNSQDGVRFNNANNNVIGGAALAACNVISANGFSGINVTGDSATGNVIQGNIVGLAANGSTPLPNAWIGITAGGITLYSSGNTIGGTNACEGNIISGNTKYGVYINGTNAFGNVVMGNMIGLAADGVTSAGNGFHGVYISQSASNTIGGISSGTGNFIAYNSFSGVCVIHSNAIGNAILGNSIYSNTLLGIDLIDDGENEISGIVEANDFRNYDNDNGPNGLQNYPSSNSVEQSQQGHTLVSGILFSKTGVLYRVEFFASPAGDSSGYGEGRYFMGYQDVLTNTNGWGSISITLGPGMAKGHVLTATATDPENNTSEFCAFEETIFVDDDMDDIEFYWEVKYNLDHLTPNTGDIDGDGFSDLKEFYADTNPTNANDFPQITAISNATRPSVYFSPSPRRMYRLRMSSDLSASNSWNRIGPQLQGGFGEKMSLDGPPDGRQGHFRLDITLP